MRGPAVERVLNACRRCDKCPCVHCRDCANRFIQPPVERISVVAIEKLLSRETLQSYCDIVLNVLFEPTAHRTAQIVKIENGTYWCEMWSDFTSALWAAIDILLFVVSPLPQLLP